MEYTDLPSNPGAKPAEITPRTEKTYHVSRGDPILQETVETVLDAFYGLEHDKNPPHPDQKEIATVGLQWVQTLLNKNKDYGSTVFDSPTLAPGLPPASAILVRMSDKVSRIANLLKLENECRGHSVASEPLEDSVQDLGAYCLLWLIARKRASNQPNGSKDDD